MAIYNKALHRIQEYKPPEAYLLSKNWEYKQRGKTYKGEHSLERLAAVDFSDVDWEFYYGNQEAVASLAESVGFRYSYDTVSKQYSHASGIIVISPS